jgi:hypothetical protein
MVSRSTVAASPWKAAPHARTAARIKLKTTKSQQNETVASFLRTDTHPILMLWKSSPVLPALLEDRASKIHLATEHDQDAGGQRKGNVPF